MTFAPDSMKKTNGIEQQPKPGERKELSETDKAEQLQRKKEMIQEEFESAQEQLDEVEAMLASPDLDSARKAELESEVEMIQSTMDSMEAELAALNTPEEVVTPVDNKVVEDAGDTSEAGVQKATETASEMAESQEIKEPQILTAADVDAAFDECFQEGMKSLSGTDVEIEDIV